jgi:hypothetical protein
MQRYTRNTSVPSPLPHPLISDFALIDISIQDLPTFGRTAFSGEATIGLPSGFPIQDWTRYRGKLRVRFAVEDEIKLIPPNGNDGDGDGDGDVEMKEVDARD